MASKVKCKYCGEYVDKETAYQFGFSSFCNRDHFYAFKVPRKSTKPKSKPKTKRSKPGVPPQVAESVLERDHHRCRLCGSGSNLHLHHIVYRSEGGPHVEENLITLCSLDHNRVHSDKKVWQSHLQEIVRGSQNKSKSPPNDGDGIHVNSKD